MSQAPTPEQERILDTARAGGDVVIEAGAGTGKTSTLRMLAGDRPRVRGMYLAYNRAIAIEASGTFGRNVTCRTAHSVAFGAVGRHYRHRLDSARMPAAEIARCLGIPSGQGGALDLGATSEPVRPKHLARLTMTTVERFCHSADTTIGVAHVPHVAGYDPQQTAHLQAAVTGLACHAWDDLTRPDGVLRFTHDVYLKLWALSRPRLPADVVMLDEAQDANPAIAVVVDDQDHAQRIAVGDRCQSLYGWRGAVDAMSGWDWPRLQLSLSFRFGDAIADEANDWLHRLGTDLRLSGSLHIASRVGLVGEPDAILCRSNAGTVAAALDELAAGRRVAIVGGVDAVVSLARASIDLRAGRGTDHPELFAFPDWEQLREYAECDPGGSDLRAFVRLVDTHGPHRVIALESALDREDRADVIVSTGHKAKGREWPRVRVYDDFTAPDEPTDPLQEPVIPRADAMLAYVAVTRAQHALDLGSLRWARQEPWSHATCPPPPTAAPPPRRRPAAPTDAHAWLMGAPA